MSLLLCPVFYSKSIFNSKLFLLSSLGPHILQSHLTQQGKYFSIRSSGWGFCWGQCFRAWYRMSLQFSESWLSEITDKLSFCSGFPTEHITYSGEMGKMYFPSPASSLCSTHCTPQPPPPPPHPRHNNVLPHTPSLFLFNFFLPLWLRLFFFGLWP